MFGIHISSTSEMSTRFSCYQMSFPKSIVSDMGFSVGYKHLNRLKLELTSDVELYCHAPYEIDLLNLPRVDFDLVVRVLTLCNLGGVKYLVIHYPTHKLTHLNVLKLIDNVYSIVNEVFNNRVIVLLENTTFTSTLDMLDMFKIVSKVPQTGVCFDTAHAWAGGIPLDEFDNFVTSPSTKLLHFNPASESCRFGGGLENHIYKSIEVCCKPLRDWLLSKCKLPIPKILEQQPEIVINSWKFLKKHM